MEIHKYNRLKVASKRVQSEDSFDSDEWEQARPQVTMVLAEKEKTGTWIAEQRGHSSTTDSGRRKTKVQPTRGKFDLVARLSEKSTRLLVTSMWM